MVFCEKICNKWKVSNFLWFVTSGGWNPWDQTNWNYEEGRPFFDECSNLALFVAERPTFLVLLVVCRKTWKVRKSMWYLAFATGLVGASTIESRQAVYMQCKATQSSWYEQVSKKYLLELPHQSKNLRFTPWLLIHFKHGFSTCPNSHSYLFFATRFSLICMWICI